jgi:2-polyprenyl-6-methoxyphenol hydroxylase-like FAD-dependent oxidoreductase
VEVRWEKKVVGVKEDIDGITVVFEDGTSDTADLVLRCDGIDSALRALYVTPETVPQYSGLSSIFGSSSTQDMPGVSTPVTCIYAMFTQNGLFAIMPCTEAGDTLH